MVINEIQRFKAVREGRVPLPAGELSQTIQAQARNQSSEMVKQLAQMQSALRTLVGDVRAGVYFVSTASREIAGGNADLSTRTEQQAGNLQQTTARMGLMSSVVQHNAANAHAASESAAVPVRWPPPHKRCQPGPAGRTTWWVCAPPEFARFLKAHKQKHTNGEQRRPAARASKPRVVAFNPR